jgi:hypothetical protein
VGGGIAGYGLQFDDDDFFRDAVQFGYNLTLGTGGVVHELHFGYQYLAESEDLQRTANGWGAISVPGGRVAAVNGQRPYYTARIQQQLNGQDAVIHSESKTHNFELNDTIKWGNWTFNAGAVVSQDTLYGQGLREDASTLSGYVAAPGNKYKMYEIPFSEMFQPRLGTTWAYDGTNTVYASYARYNPSASSLPRAASWDRNIVGTFVDVHFDPNGVAFAAVPVGSSSGKLFVPDLSPRIVNEYLAGTARQLSTRWTGRLYGRYRKSTHFWEDTNNTAPIKSGNESATCRSTSPLRRLSRRLVLVKLLVSNFSEGAEALRAACTAGARLNNKPITIERIMTKPTNRHPNAALRSSRGPSGTNIISAALIHIATNTPAAPPNKESNNPSVSH